MRDIATKRLHSVSLSYSLMQVLAHHGPNWTSESVDASADGDVIAVAVGRTVMLYAVHGTCSAELRATSHGGVVSVSFCQSQALTHLLAVLTNESVLRIFDIASRRIVRSLCDGRIGKADRLNGTPFAVRFFPNAPHLAFVLSVTGDWHLLRVNASKTPLLRKGFLPLRTVSSLTSHESRLFVAGDEENASVVCILSLKVERCGNSSYVSVQTQKIHSAVRINDISIRTDGNSFAAMGTKLASPIIRNLFDDDGGNENIGRNSSDPRHKAHKNVIRACVTWVDDNFLISSDARGSLTLWHVDDDEQLARKVACQPRAHVRQVVCIRPVRTCRCDSNPKRLPYVLTASADRTVAVWGLSGMDEDMVAFKLSWRSIQTTGCVQHLSFKKCMDEQEQRETDSNDTGKRAVLTFATSNGTVSSIVIPTTLPVGDKCESSVQIPHTLSEMTVAASHESKLGKRARGSKNGRGRTNDENGTGSGSTSVHPSSKVIVGLSGCSDATIIAQFLTGDDRLGFIQKTTDGRITCSTRTARASKENLRTEQRREGLDVWTIDKGFVEGRGGHLSLLSASESELKYSTKSWEVWSSSGVSSSSSQQRASLLAVAVHPVHELMIVVDCEGRIWQCFTHRNPKLLHSWSDDVEENEENSKISFTSVAVAIDETVALGTSCGKFLVSARGACRIQDGSGMDERREGFEWQKGSLEGCASVGVIRWSFDSRMILVVQSNGTVSIWTRQDGNNGKDGGVMNEVTRIKVQHGAVKDAVWVAARTLATGGSDGSVRLWDVSRLPVCLEKNSTRALKNLNV